jgi:hypothetical protein
MDAKAFPAWLSRKPASFIGFLLFCGRAQVRNASRNAQLPIPLAFTMPQRVEADRGLLA